MKVKRLLLSAVLSTALSLFVVPQTVEVKAATEVKAAGTAAVEKQRIGNTSVYWEIKEDGTLIVSGKGDPYTSVDDIPWHGYENRIKSVTIKKGVTPKNVSSWFSGCTSLIEAPVIPEGVENCCSMFYGCTSLKKAPTIPKGVKDCSSMFNGCTSLKDAPVIPEGVKDCRWMFDGCTSLEKAPVIPKGVENCREMFYGCTSLVKASTIPKGVEYCYSMFEGCTSLEKAPVIQEGMESCNWMFKNCTSLVKASTIPPSVGSCSEMFYGCTSLKEAPIIPKGVTYCPSMFMGCTSLKKPPVIPAGVWNCENMFSGCTSLVKVPVIPAGARNCNGMFNDCTSLVEAPVIPNGAENCGSMFSGCTSLKKAPVIPRGVENCYCMFSGCTSLTGEVLVNNKPIYYAGMFVETKLPISLVYGGDCTKELAEEIASECSNVSVAPSVKPIKNPGQVKNVKVTQKKKGVKPTVTFSKVSSVKGYQIQYSSNSKFSKSTSIYTTNLKATLSKVVKGKKYFVRVRALKFGSNKKKLYGKWSDVKSITVK